jgi:hypothetical protein
MTVLKIAALTVVTVVFLFSPWAMANENEVKKGETDWMKVDSDRKNIIFSATVTKNSSKAAVTTWGQRGQAWIGCKDGSQEKFFIFTTDVARSEIDKSIQILGAKYHHQIPKEGWKKHRGVKETMSLGDFLDGDPVMVSIRFQKDGKSIQIPLENLIEEKIEIDGKEVFRPYTPHYVYHGTGESIQYPSGCIVCPSDCFGGIITDNRLPVLTYDSWYRVNWNKMPPVGSKVEVIFQFAVL